MALSCTNSSLLTAGTSHHPRTDFAPFYRLPPSTQKLQLAPLFISTKHRPLPLKTQYPFHQIAPNANSSNSFTHSKTHIGLYSETTAPLKSIYYVMRYLKSHLNSNIREQLGFDLVTRYERLEK